MLEIAAAIAILLVVSWIAKAVFLDINLQKTQPNAPSVYPSYSDLITARETRVGQTNAAIRVRVEAAKEMLAGSNRAIFQRQGELLGHVNTLNPAELRAAAETQRRAETAWRLAKDQVKNTYGYAIFRTAMRELSFD